MSGPTAATWSRRKCPLFRPLPNRFLDGRGPDEIAVAPAPKWLLDLVTAQGPASEDPKEIPPPSRRPSLIVPVPTQRRRSGGSWSGSEKAPSHQRNDTLNRAAVKAIHTAGIVFAITSGRPPRGMAMLIDPLALRSPVAGFNGGIFVKPDMTIMEEHVLAAEVARRALEVILHHGMDVWVYSGKDWFVRDPNAPSCRARAMDGPSSPPPSSQNF